jgi:acyl carrier protein
MKTKEKIIDIIYKVIDEVNEDRFADENQIIKSLDTRLFGGDSIIDSLGLVHLIVLIEEKVNEEFDLTLIIADERAMSQRNSPFKSVDTFADYILELIKEQKI